MTRNHSASASALNVMKHHLEALNALNESDLADTLGIFRIIGSLEINLIVGYRKINIYLILDAGLVRTGPELPGNQSPFKKRAQSRFTFWLTSTGLIRMKL